MKRFRTWMHSAYFKILLAILMIGALIATFCVYVSVNSVQQARRQAVEDRKNVMALYLQQLDNSLTLATVRCANQFSDEADYVHLANPIPGERQQAITLSQTAVKNELDTLIDSFSVLGGAFAYFPRRERMVCVRNNSSAQMAFALSALDEDGLNAVFSSSWSVIELEGEQYLAMMRLHRNGYYGMWVSPEELMGSWNLASQEEEWYGLAAPGDVLPSGIQMEEVLARQGDDAFCTIDGMVYAALKSGCGDFYFYSATPVNRGSAIMGPALFVVLAAVIVALLAGPLLYWYFRRVIVQPVDALMEGMRKVEGGNTDYRIPEQASSQEFERLNGHFNHMMDRIQELKLDVYQSELERADIRMRYLSQQIQPHFILNTLNLIYSYEPEEYDLIQRLILCLVRYYRYIVSASAHFVLLEKELEHIQNYFAIQQARYPGVFITEIRNEVPEGAMIPPLIIQTFAENFIKFAISGEKTIGIYIHAEPTAAGGIRLKIWDTGAGYEPEVLEEIRAFQLHQGTGTRLGVGIRNVIERLELLYDKQAEISFANRSEGGAMVVMELPLKSEVREWNC